MRAHWKHLLKTTWVLVDQQGLVQAQVVATSRISDTWIAWLGTKRVMTTQNPELAKAILETQWNIQELELDTRA